MPALAGAEPGDVRRDAAAGRRRRGRPDHHRVVGVGDHVHVRVPAERGAPQLRHHRDLLGPVELVAGEVEQRDHVRLGGLEHLGEVVLVDLQHGERRAAGLGQRGGVPGRHVGAEGVGGDLAEHAERGGGEPGGGGLAVGAGDQRDRRGRPPGARAGRGRSSGRSSRRSPSRRRGRRRGTAPRRSATPSWPPSPAGAVFSSVTRARLPDRRCPPDRRRRRSVRPGTLGRPVGARSAGRSRSMSGSGRALAGASPLHSAPPRSDVRFCRRATARHAGDFRLPVEGSGVEWGAMAGREGPPARGVSGAANAAQGRGGGGRCFSAPTLRAWTTRAG